MTPDEEAKQLYEELHKLYQDMRPFFTPHPADEAKEWTEAEADYYFGLYQRMGQIVARLTELHL